MFGRCQLQASVETFKTPRACVQTHPLLNRPVKLTIIVQLRDQRIIDPAQLSQLFVRGRGGRRWSALPGHAEQDFGLFDSLDSYRGSISTSSPRLAIGKARARKPLFQRQPIALAKLTNYLREDHPAVQRPVRRTGSAPGFLQARAWP